MKKGTNLMKRVLSFVMAFAMMLTLVPATALHARAATGGETLYFVPGDQWGSDNAWYAAYYFGAGEAWSALSDSNGDGYYETTVPDGGYTNVIFCRMNPASTALDWSYKWNQTPDLNLTLGNCFTMANDTQWTTGNGTWSTRYSVSFDANGGAGEMASVTVDAGSAYTLPECTFTAPAGKQFGMWVMGSDAYNPGEEITVIEDTVVRASWSDKTYTLTYDYNGGTDASGNSSSTDDFAEGAELTQASAPVPQRDGYTLTGWTLENGTTVTFPYNMPAEAVTFYAQWEEQEGAEEPADPETYTVYCINSANWDAVAAYAWIEGGVDTAWPGVPMTKTDATVNGFDVYSVTFDVAYENVIFNNNGNGSQTSDLTLMAGQYYDLKNNDWYASLPDVPAIDVLATGRYLVGDFNGWIATANEFKLDAEESQIGYVSLELEAETDYEFKVVQEGSWTSCATTITDTVAGLVFSSSVDENVKITTTIAGTYVFAFDVSGSALSVTYPKAEEPSEPTNPNTYEATFHFADVLGWGGVNLYTWTDAGTHCGSWPGTAVSKGDDGFYTMTVSFEAETNTGLNFIFNNGSAQTVNLALAASDFVDNKAEKWVVLTTTDSEGKYNANILDSGDSIAVDKNEVTINVHYTRSDGDYDGWNLWVWGSAIAGHQVDFEKTDSDGSKVATIVLEDARAHSSISFKERLSIEGNEWKEQGDSNRTIDLSTIVSGTIDYYIPSGGCTYNVVRKNKISSASLNYDTSVVTFTTAQQIADPANEVTLVKVEGETETTVEATVSGGGTTYTLTLNAGAWDLKTLYQYKIKYQGFTYAIGIDAVYASKKFATEYTYTGKDLGATWSSASTTFKVWAPTAETVSVKLYDLSNKVYTARETTYPMTAGANGTWAVTIDGDLNGVYYNYLVTVDGGDPVEAVDPYARTTGVNGKIGMVIDLDSTDPADGWSEITNKPESYTDAVIYELHVRDFSIDDSSGVKDEWQGKFLGLTQTGTTSTDGKTVTGLDYLKDLGITHLHLLPIYDYASVDETTCKTFNWGYDPQNYNTPEGSYSTNPYDGATRVKEMKEMVDTLHENGIGVIMDVVYNHVYNADTFCFNNIVPGYFSRVDSNRSGCGNDTASEREMVRKYIVESVLYWHQEYHIDGFRFDLVGLLDVETINQIVTEVHASSPDVIFYGEGWDMDDTNKEPGTEMAKQGNASKTPGFAYFSDSMRNGIGGSNGTSTGFASGAGNGTSMVSEWLGKPWWTSNPQQVVQYASCHDNYTLIDKLILSTGASEITDDIISMNNLAAAYYMTSQGIAFIHAGEEMLREKLEKNGDRCENSYNASDYVNHIEWSNLEKDDYADTSAYYQGLIEFRKAHPALRYDTAAKVSANVKNTMSSANVVAFQIDGYAAGDKDDIYIIFNAGTSATTVTLPTGTWNININKADAGTESLGTASGSVSVDGISAMVLTKADEGKDSASSSGTVTLYFTNNKNWSNVYAYAWDVNGNAVTAAWPGTEMTWVEKNSYNQDVYSVTLPASATGVVFNGGSDETKTENLVVGVDGTGYYFNDEGVIVSYPYRAPVSGGGSGSADDYYLFGWINNANYACEENATSTGDYKFEDGTVTATFETDSYVGVKTGDNSVWYMTNGWLGNVTSATLYNSTVTGENSNKLFVPRGVEVTFTLVVNDDDTVTLSYVAKKDTNSYSATDTSGIQNGVTLHCWNWSFNEIKANMASIAAAGYTAIQTSPIQPLKETTTDSDKTVKGNWWVYYQPVDFEINDADGNALGKKDEFEAMCAEAEKYGIKVIVDVVANHLANIEGNDLSTAIPDSLRNNTDYWHDITINTTKWTDRYDMTQHCMNGLPDLNTGNDEIQEKVLAFLKDCIDAGVDGFRFDAAKHIETPEDDSTFASDFWPTVIGGAEEYAKSKGKDIYCYGETLDSWNDLPVSAYTKYMAITDNTWSNTLRKNISGGTAAMSPGYDRAAVTSQLVLWAESHDTYATEDTYQSSAGVSVANINKTWALVAARADAMGLYFARPESLNQALGVASVTGWANAEVKAVNEFHNAFDGQSEYIDTEDGIVYVERGTSGVVLVNASGTTANVSVTANTIANGTYTDQITGNSFVVTDGKITGSIGSTGIAVVYNAEELIDLKGATMTLGNSLAMNFVIDTAELIGTDNYAVITKEYADGTGSKSVTIKQADWKVYDGTMYYFTYSKVAAKEMTDKITVVVYNSAGEAVTNSWTDSVRDYCMRAIKAEEEGNKNQDKLTLYVDMLNYGAAAQTEFENYHSDDLATSQLTEAQKGYATGDVNAEDHRVTGAGYLGSTLTLGNEIELNFIFDRITVTQDMYAIATYTNHYGKEKSVTIAGSAFGEYNKDNVKGWYIPVADMSVADGCQVNGESKFMVTCTVYNAYGTVVTSARDSVASYVARANADTNNTNSLYTLILKFATSAYNYFH